MTACCTRTKLAYLTSSGAFPARLPSRSDPCSSHPHMTSKTTAGKHDAYASCHPQLRNDQERLQMQIADSKQHSAELSTKLEQERKGKEDSVRTRPLEGLQPRAATVG